MNRSSLFALILIFVVVIGLVYFLILPQAAKKAPLGAVTRYTASHTLDAEEHTLSSNVELLWFPAKVDTFMFLLHSGLMIDRIEVPDALTGELLLEGQGQELMSLEIWNGDVPDSSDVAHLSLFALPIQGEYDSLTIKLSYHGEIHDDVEVASFSRWEIADETTGLIGPKGAFLTPATGYYPSIPGDESLATFRTTIVLPDGWDGLVEGNVLERNGSRISFDSVHPMDGSYLVAGPYQRRSINADGVEIAMYYYPQSAHLVDRYLGMSARYMADYQRLIGEYPFERFSIVENFFPTGYGMPGYTLLGSQVLALPFIPFTSLPHEIAHNWWGNGCYVDYETGNWCEGLTTYYADYRLKEESSPEEGKQYRLDVLRDYSDYVVRGDEEDFALREFTSRTTAGTRTIGYGKSMMVFHMVRNRIGNDLFWESLSDLYSTRKFTTVSWNDIFSFFEKHSSEDLASFKTQWIGRTGAPHFALENVQSSAIGDDGLHRIEFDIKQLQTSSPYRIDIPITVSLMSDSVYKTVLRDVHGSMYHARVQVPGAPVALSVDPDFDLFRVLDPLEAPATLSAFYGEESPVAVLPDGDPLREAYRRFAETFFKRSGVDVVSLEEYEAGEFDGRATLFLGGGRHSSEAADEMRRSGKALDEPDLAVIAAFRDETNPNMVHIELNADSEAALSAIIRKLPHYGKYSYLAFSAGQNTGKGQWMVTESPLIHTF
jgi:hypothetical protein